MADVKQPALSRRERQIMDIIFARGEVTAAEVNAALPDQPSYSTVRTLLRILEDKGHLKHREDGQRFVYMPTKSRTAESNSLRRRRWSASGMSFGAAYSCTCRKVRGVGSSVV